MHRIAPTRIRISAKAGILFAHGNSRTSDRGFSLVEVLVSAAILIVLIFAVIAAVRKGRELQMDDGHRRSARVLIHSKLETIYDFRNFNTDFVNDSFSDTLDSRTGNPVVAKGFVTVVNDTPLIGPGGGTPVPRKKITITVKWSETGLSASDKVTDSIQISKWIAKAKE
jgi:competence protein ComGC